MKVIRKKVFISHEGENAPFPGFVNYIHRDKPWLVHRYGWEEESDNRDNWMDIFSEDNGRTWSEPVLAQKSQAIAGGRIKYAENSVYFDSDTNQVLVIASKGLYPENQLTADTRWMLEISRLNPDDRQWTVLEETNLGFLEGIAVSFTFPIKTSAGRLIFPACKPVIGSDGKFVYYQDYRTPAYQSLVVIGEYQKNGSLTWQASEPVALDMEKSCRGWDENTVIELKDGRIAMIIRGSNQVFQDRPGYKWLAFSNDGGLSWSAPEPWRYDDAKPVESSATGSSTFRSIKNGKMYWIGNICPADEKVRGNWPRSPLVIGQVCEESFTLMRNTVTVIDQRGSTDSPGVQMSNFRYYQDRSTGDIVLYLTRFGERSEEHWKLADYYEYRIAL